MFAHPVQASTPLQITAFSPVTARASRSQILIKALKDGMNIGPDFATVIGATGILSVPNSPLATTFDLNNLDAHNFPVEHDASLSRADKNLNSGDNYSFNQTDFDTVLAYYDGMENMSIPVARKRSESVPFFSCVECLWGQG